MNGEKGLCSKHLPCSCNPHHIGEVREAQDSAEKRFLKEARPPEA